MSISLHLVLRFFNWDCACNPGYQNSSYNYANGKYYGDKCTFEYSPYSDGRAWCYIGGNSCSDIRYDSDDHTIYIGDYSGTGWQYSYLGCDQQPPTPGNLFLSSQIYQKKNDTKNMFLTEYFRTFWIIFNPLNWSTLFQT